MQTQLTQQEKFKILTQDLFQDRNGRFVKIRTRDRLGWEELLPQDGAYSSMILSPKDDEELLKSAVRIARQMLISMNPGRPLRVLVHPDTSMTDGNAVWVATKVLDEKRLPVGKRLDTFLGFTVHEGSHVLWTDFTCLETIKNRIVGDLQNIIEDERIERLLGEDKPGLANYLMAAKYYCFDSYMNEIGQEGLNDLCRLLNCILMYVRYPASLNPDEVMEFADELMQVRAILTPYPDSTCAAVEAAEAIYEVIRRFVPKEQPQPGQGTPQESEGGEGESESDNKPNNGNSRNKDNSDNRDNGDNTDNKDNNDNKDNKDSKDNKGGKKSRSNSQSSGKTDSSDTSDESESESQSGNKPDKESSDDKDEEGNGDDTTGGDDEFQQNEPMSDDELLRQLDAILKAIGELSGKEACKKEGDMSQAAREDNGLLAKEIDGLLKRGKDHDNIFIEAAENKESYKTSLSRVSRYIPAIRRALTDNDFSADYTLLGMRSGRLDTNKLAEARQSVQTVYTRTIKAQPKPMNVVLLIDESGSMHSRCVLCRDAAVLIQEAVENIPDIHLSIYGYTTGRGCKNVILTYRDYWDKRPNKYRIGSISAYGGTPTRDALLEITAKVSENSSDRTILFILSDGAPDTSLQSVKQAVDEATRRGITVIGISVASSLGEDTLKAMYGHYLVMNDNSDLPKELGKTIKKAIIRSTR